MKLLCNKYPLPSLACSQALPHFFFFFEERAWKRGYPLPLPHPLSVSHCGLHKQHDIDNEVQHQPDDPCDVVANIPPCHPVGDTVGRKSPSSHVRRLQPVGSTGKRNRTSLSCNRLSHLLLELSRSLAKISQLQNSLKGRKVFYAWRVQQKCTMFSK